MSADVSVDVLLMPCRAIVIADEAFRQRMVRKRVNFDIDTQVSMPEEVFRMLFILSGLAEPAPGDANLYSSLPIRYCRSAHTCVREIEDQHW